MKYKLQKILRTLEFIVLFFGVPILLYFDTIIQHPSLILLPVIIALFLFFWKSKNFKFKSLVRLNIDKSEILKNIGVIVIIAFALLIYVLIFEEKNLFNLPRRNIKIWLMLGATYTLFSAYPQEIIYRTFLFKRYSFILKKRSYLIVASGVTFSFAHIVYYSPVSMLLTLLAGLYLAYVYEKTGSVLFTTILHSIYGLLVFSVGLGHHFWLNMEQYL